MKNKRKKKKQTNAKFVVGMIVAMLVGVMSIVFGIRGSINLKEKTKEYVSIEARFYDYSVYSSNSDGETYRLEYEYIVNGKKYYISTDYGTGVIPKLGSVKTIKYNPNNPSEAIFTGGGSNVLMLVIGFMFFFIPLVMLMSEGNKKNGTQKQKKFKSLFTSLLLGIAFAGMGIGTYYLMCSGTDSLSPVSAFSSAGIFAIIPIIFIMLGIYMIVLSLFPPKKKEVILAVEDVIGFNIGGNNILLSDVSIAENSIQAMGGKYFVYSPKNKAKFEKGKEFKVNIYKYGIMHDGIQISQAVQARYLNQFVDDDFEEV